MIVTALVAGLASGVFFDEATRVLGRNYYKVPANDRLTPSLTTARYFVKVAAFGLSALSVIVALAVTVRRFAIARAAFLVITVAAAGVVAAATCAFMAAPLGKAGWPAEVGLDYAVYCERHPVETYCAKGSSPLSDYLQPFGEFTSLAGLALGAGVGLPICVASGVMTALAGSRNPLRAQLRTRVALGAGTSLGSGLLSAAFFYVVNLNSPLTFSYSYHSPPDVAEFVAYCLAMLAGGMIFIAGMPALLAYFSILRAGPFSPERVY